MINEFDKNFNLKVQFESKKINIDKKVWVIENSIITTNNISKKILKISKFKQILIRKKLIVYFQIFQLLIFLNFLI